MATKIRNTQKIFTIPTLPNPPQEYNVGWQANYNAILRFYFSNVDEAISRGLQFDTSDIIDGSIPNSKLENSTVSFGGVTVSLGGADATPAFNLSDATGYPTSSLVGTITNAQLAGSIENAKLSNSTVSYGGVQLSLGGADATPAFDLSDATNYPTSSLSGTIATAQIADGAVTPVKLSATYLQNVVEDTTPQLGGNLDMNSRFILGTGTVSISGGIGSTNGHVGTTSGDIYATTGDVIAEGAEIGSGKAGSFDDSYSAGTVSSGSSTKVVNIGTGYHNGGTTTINIGPTSTATSKSINLNANTNLAGNLLTSAPLSSKHTFSTTGSQQITTTSAVTIYEPDIPAPPGGNEATQSLNAAIRVRFYNSSSSSVKENHQWKMPVAIKSKTNVGTSLGVATFLFSPSTYNAWYYVSGDKTSIFATNRGGLATSSTGANTGSFVGVYYDAANNRTVFRVSKFPDATSVYSGVEVFYSPVNFASSGTFVNDISFNNNYLTIGSTTAYQTVEFPLVFTFGRSTTATEIRIQFDHVSSTTNLGTYITSISGYVENTV